VRSSVEPAADGNTLGAEKGTDGPVVIGISEGISLGAANGGEPAEEGIALGTPDGSAVGFRSVGPAVGFAVKSATGL
jgi:hypothetical protein